MRRLAWPHVAWLSFLTSGCGPHPAAGDFRGAEISATAPTPSARGRSQTFDFGSILAHGQTLRHRFTLTNPSDKPLRLLKATCFTPCCSEVESLPDVIPPHGEGCVAVLFKPGHQSGVGAVRFAIETDSATHPTRLLTLRARMFPAWEITPAGDTAASLTIGSPERARYRVVCRRKDSEGLRLPDSIKVAEPLQARFRDSVEERSQADGVVEATREVEVTLPASPVAGVRQAEIVFIWPDGRQEKQVIRWQVRPLVHLSPSSIVIEPSSGPVERSVTITSDDRVVRITDVRGDLLSRPLEIPAVARKSLSLVLRLDPARAVAGGVSTIVIDTDHPLQSGLTLRVLVLPSSDEKRGAS